MNPTVSLLVPVFNRVDLLGPCLDSALAQTMTDLEVVVVDGASTDGTWDVCLEYAKRDPRVRVFREHENRGPVRGWFECIQHARGSLATFLWSDDLIAPTFLERTLPHLDTDDTAFAYTAAEIGRVPGTGRIAYALGSSRMMPSEEFLHGALATRGRFPLSPACGLFRLDDLRRNFVMELPTTPAFDLTSTGAGTDVLQFLLAASQRPQVAHIAEPLAFFRAHGGSISVDGHGGQVSRSYAMSKAWFAREHGYPELIPRILAWHWLGDMRDARQVISPWAAVRLLPAQTTPLRLLGAAVQVMACELVTWLVARATRVGVR